MSSPFSDTTSPSAALPNEWDQADALAARLGLPKRVNQLPAHFLRVLFVGVHTALDRLDAMEKRLAELAGANNEPNRG